jgi:hypothetical protein
VADLKAERSIEYTFLVLEVFMFSDDDLIFQLELHSLNEVDQSTIYAGDVTFGEYEFVLLKEIEFRLACVKGFKTAFHDQVAKFLKELV